jgi:hypothetical protein
MSDVSEPTIECPYAGCGIEMTVLDFARHVLSGTHKYDSQTVFCPICKFLGEESGVDTTRLNLWAHLNGDHGDVMSVAIAEKGRSSNPFSSPPVPKPVKQPLPVFTFNPPFNAPLPPPPPSAPKVVSFSVPNKRPAPDRVAFRYKMGHDSNARNSNSQSRYAEDVWDDSEENNWDSEGEEEEEDDEEEDDSIGSDFFDLFNDQAVSASEDDNNNNNSSKNITTQNSNFPMPISIPPPLPPPLPKITTTVTTTTTSATTTIATTVITTTLATPPTTTFAAAPPTELTFNLPVAVTANYMSYALEGKLPERECSICFDDFQQGEMVARVECMCIFHQCCIEQWFQKRKCCPFHMSSEDE